MNLNLVEDQDVLRQLEGVGSVDAQGVMDAGTVRPQTKLVPVDDPELLNTLEPSQFESAWRGFGDTISLGFGDEIAGVIGGVESVVKGDEGGFSGGYNQTVENVRGQNQQAQQANPLTYMGGQVAGGVAQGFAPVGAALRGATMVGKVGRGMAAGGVQGAAYGAGSGETPSDRLQGAVNEGAKGVAIGGALPIAGRAVGAAWRGTRNLVSNRGIKNDLGVGSGAASRVIGAAKDDFESGTMKRPTTGDMVLNTGEALKADAEAIASFPGAPRAITQKAVREQRAGVSPRLNKAINDSLGPDRGRVVTQNIEKMNRRAAGQLFQTAKRSSMVHDMQPVAAQLQALQQRGIVQGGVLNRIASLPAVKNGGPASSSELHDLRMLLDDILNKKIGDTSLQANAARAVGNLRDIVDAELKRVPGWREADKGWSIAVGAEKALEDGRNLFSAGKTAMAPDELIALKKSTDPRVWESAVQGARDDVSRMLGTARNDAGTVYRELTQKDWNREKLGILFGERQADRLVSYLEREAARQGTQADLVSSTQTARRLQAAKKYPNPGAKEERYANTSQRTVAGTAIEYGAKAIDKLLGGALEARANAISSDAAKLLTATGADRTRIVNALQNAVKRHGVNSAKGKKAEEFITKLIGGQVAFDSPVNLPLPVGQ